MMVKGLATYATWIYTRLHPNPRSHQSDALWGAGTESREGQGEVQKIQHSCFVNSLSREGCNLNVTLDTRQRRINSSCLFNGWLLRLYGIRKAFEPLRGGAVDDFITSNYSGFSHKNLFILSEAFRRGKKDEDNALKVILWKALVEFSSHLPFGPENCLAVRLNRAAARRVVLQCLCMLMRSGSLRRRLLMNRFS